MLACMTDAKKYYLCGLILLPIGLQQCYATTEPLALTVDDSFYLMLFQLSSPA
jgi:hypothetical protein